ncbi:flagellar hook-length control protein FliK [Castellaniella sp.]|uniref:flagellar hook-length control protein FliK n=1 Tax=Castellaniella sp. TaxID=1955812 RepID=UPI002B000ADD|nr:flagellar hook-length control protein FliK [Castellaniella sp.]
MQRLPPTPSLGNWPALDAPQDGKKQQPLGPDEALALILDAAALPLMQAPTDTAAARFSVHNGQTDTLTAVQTAGRHTAAPRDPAAMTQAALPLLQTSADTASSRLSVHGTQVGTLMTAQAAAAGRDAAAPRAPAPLGQTPATMAQALAINTTAQVDIRANNHLTNPRLAQADALQLRGKTPSNTQARATPDIHPTMRADSRLADPLARFVATAPSGSSTSGNANPKTASMLLSNIRADAANSSTQSVTDATQAIRTALAANISQQPLDTTLPPPQATPLGAMLMAPATPAAGTGGLPLPLQISVPTPFNSPQWPQDVGRQLLSLTQAGAGVGNHTVVMHVNPPELGPVHITLHLGDSLQAAFVSPHANVRQALENALPHLQQQLAQSGLSLGQANVSDQQPGQQQFAQGSDQGTAHTDGAVFSLDGSTDSAASIPAGTAAPTQRIIHPDSLVDTFA